MGYFQRFQDGLTTLKLILDWCHLDLNLLNIWGRVNLHIIPKIHSFQINEIFYQTFVK